MEDRTYIKIFRKMLGWGWYGDTNTVRVFLHILLRANYKDSEYRGHIIPAGSCVFGRKQWAKELGLSERQVRTSIAHLKSTNEITTKSTNKFTVITLTNWEFWQIEEGRATKRTTNKKSNERPTTDQQPTTSKEIKNIRNTTPTIYMVREYCEENGLIIDPDYFFKYYETAEWKDAKGKPVRNWKLKALNWNKREVDKQNVQHDTRTSRDKRVRVSGTTEQGKGGYEAVSTKLPPISPELLADVGSEDDVRGIPWVHQEE